MATSVRNTGTRFRYDADDQKWKAKVRMTSTSTDGERFWQEVGEFITLLELLAFLSDMFNGIAGGVDTTLQGHTGPAIIVSEET